MLNDDPNVTLTIRLIMQGKVSWIKGLNSRGFIDFFVMKTSYTAATRFITNVVLKNTFGYLDFERIWKKGYPGVVISVVI